jgi:hypothetical protein
MICRRESMRSGFEPLLLHVLAVIPRAISYATHQPEVPPDGFGQASSHWFLCRTC